MKTKRIQSWRKTKPRSERPNPNPAYALKSDDGKNQNKIQYRAYAANYSDDGSDENQQNPNPVEKNYHRCFTRKSESLKCKTNAETRITYYWYSKNQSWKTDECTKLVQKINSCFGRSFSFEEFFLLVNVF